jgi:hypothetical protein
LQWLYNAPHCRKSFIHRKHERRKSQWMNEMTFFSSSFSLNENLWWKTVFSDKKAARQSETGSEKNRESLWRVKNCAVMQSQEERTLIQLNCV